MMDGAFTVYMVQHRYERRNDWTDSALDHMLFGNMSYEDNRGELGDTYRALIAPTHECWQVTRVHGFLDAHDAWRAHDACVQEHPEHEFRVVRRTWAQVTVPESRPLSMLRMACR